MHWDKIAPAKLEETVFNDIDPSSVVSFYFVVCNQCAVGVGDYRGRVGIVGGSVGIGVGGVGGGVDVGVDVGCGGVSIGVGGGTDVGVDVGCDGVSIGVGGGVCVVFLCPCVIFRECFRSTVVSPCILSNFYCEHT